MRAIILLAGFRGSPPRQKWGLIDRFKEMINGKLAPERALFAAEHQPLPLLWSMGTVPGHGDVAGCGPVSWARKSGANCNSESVLTWVPVPYSAWFVGQLFFRTTTIFLMWSEGLCLSALYISATAAPGELQCLCVSPHYCCSGTDEGRCLQSHQPVQNTGKYLLVHSFWEQPPPARQQANQHGLHSILFP